MNRKCESERGKNEEWLLGLERSQVTGRSPGKLWIHMGWWVWWRELGNGRWWRCGETWFEIQVVENGREHSLGKPRQGRGLWWVWWCLIFRDTWLPRGEVSSAALGCGGDGSSWELWDQDSQTTVIMILSNIYEGLLGARCCCKSFSYIISFHLMQASLKVVWNIPDSSTLTD